MFTAHFFYLALNLGYDGYVDGVDVYNKSEKTIIEIKYLVIDATSLDILRMYRGNEHVPKSLWKNFNFGQHESFDSCLLSRIKSNDMISATVFLSEIQRYEQYNYWFKQASIWTTRNRNIVTELINVINYVFYSSPYHWIKYRYILTHERSCLAKDQFENLEINECENQSIIFRFTSYVKTALYPQIARVINVNLMFKNNVAGMINMLIYFFSNKIVQRFISRTQRIELEERGYISLMDFTCPIPFLPRFILDPLKSSR